MQNVLFKTDKPASAPGYAEFYDLALIQEHCDGQLLSLFQETHGWWDNETNRAVIDDSAPSTRVVFKTFCEALDAYHRCRMARAGSGFKHSFMWHPISGIPAYYMPVDLPDESPAEMPIERKEEPFDDFALGA
jgi:hypothetical protein